MKPLFLQRINSCGIFAEISTCFRCCYESTDVGCRVTRYRPRGFIQITNDVKRLTCALRYMIIQSTNVCIVRRCRAVFDLDYTA